MIKHIPVEVYEAMRKLVADAALFSDAALEQLKMEDPAAYEALDGLTVFTVTLASDPIAGRYVSEIAAVVGGERRVIATVPMQVPARH